MERKKKDYECLGAYTIAELELIVFNESKCYKQSEAFRMCLAFVNQTNYPMYKDMLYKEMTQNCK